MKRFYELSNGYKVDRFKAGKYLVIDNNKPLYVGDSNGRLKFFTINELVELSKKER